MPRLPIDYSKTIIYKICCNDVSITDIYVGHTTDIIRRRQNHKDCCKYEFRKEYNTYKYQFIRDNGGWDNWSLVPVEEYPCENVNQASIRERYWVETLQASLNKQIPSRSNQEFGKIYYQNNKEKINEKNMKNHRINKEKLTEKFICDCGGCYTFRDKAKHFKTKKHQEYLSTINENRQESTEQTIT